MKIALSLFAVLAVLAVLAIVIKLISGAAMIITGAFNAILGIAVVAALIIIVVWMFSYARKKR